MISDLLAKDVVTIVAHEDVASLGAPLAMDLSPVLVPLELTIVVKLDERRHR